MEKGGSWGKKLVGRNRGNAEESGGENKEKLVEEREGNWRGK